MLQEYGLSPLHKLGQNFLHDHNILNKLVDFSKVNEGDLVLEVGPGTGGLTEVLLERGCRVIACELDKGLTELLKDRFGKSINLVHGDVLFRKQLNSQVVEEIGSQQWKLVANLPYQIASPLIVDVLSNHHNCLGLYITIQHEVAMRLMAEVDSSDWGVLSILVQKLSNVSLITKVPNTCFWPQPKITSACVAITPKSDSKKKSNEEFNKFVTMLFSKRRKQLGSILGRDMEYPIGILESSRPSTLTIDQLESLYEVVKNATSET
ncbi:MAG: 16S rRNA (adenine(1518)-N(6)/adenine(1519)-N(6))-dimethyltransferase RsmA [Phycisphaerales bacterium]|jgi:16S rRNA (adenine1518-N6/adenine1519-N6)-dimethyltransferase|nr:16S rRNA (adenine(1518)-N(6)/adenine(1519)-N(6))-dimethyltransferase RsmA [Phycisphaerales bacterium]